MQLVGYPVAFSDSLLDTQMFKSFFIFIIFMLSLEEIKLSIDLAGKFSSINNYKKKSFAFYCSLEFHLQTISKLVWSWKRTILATLPPFVSLRSLESLEPG